MDREFGFIKGFRPRALGIFGASTPPTRGLRPHGLDFPMPLPRSSWYSAGFFWYKSSLWHSAGCATRVRIERKPFCLCVAMGSALMACESWALWIRFRGCHGTTFGSSFCGWFNPFCGFKGSIFYVGGSYWRVAGSWLGLECIANFCFHDWGTTTHNFTLAEWGRSVGVTAWLWPQMGGLFFDNKTCTRIFFFSSHLFAAGTRSWTVVLGSLQAKATKGLFYWALSRQRNDCFTGHPGSTLDVEHHLQSAARAWFVHKWMLCDKHIRLGLHLKFFNAVITPVACFAAGHRTLYPRDVRRYDIEMRKMLRRMIPPPVGIDWSACETASLPMLEWWCVLVHSTYSANFDVACFQRNLFDKTVFHEFVAQAQNERRWKKERGSCSVACFASFTVNKPSQK